MPLYCNIYNVVYKYKTQITYALQWSVGWSKNISVVLITTSLWKLIWIIPSKDSLQLKYFQGSSKIYLMGYEITLAQFSFKGMEKGRTNSWTIIMYISSFNGAL